MRCRRRPPKTGAVGSHKAEYSQHAKRTVRRPASPQARRLPSTDSSAIREAAPIRVPPPFLALGLGSRYLEEASVSAGGTGSARD